MTSPALHVASLSSISPDPVRWLWPNFLPRGKLVILDGDPGVGKSMLALDLAARISRGGPFPDASSTERPQAAVILSGEDRASDTIRPRAEAAGADLERLLVAAAPDRGLLRFPADLDRLDAVVRQHQAGLVIIDPLMAFLSPEVAPHSDPCVRGPLGGLAAIAACNDCTILMIRHLRKKAAAKSIHRGLGSIGILGVVRVGLLAAPHPSVPELHVLAVTKTNLGSRPPALGYRMQETAPGRVGLKWTKPLGITADQLGVQGDSLRPRDRAADWLVTELAGGPRRAAELYALAAIDNIPERTLIRARAELGVKSHQHYIPPTRTTEEKREWYWYDPCAPWPEKAPFRRPYELPPLD